MLKFETRRIANSYGDKTRYRAILKSHGSVVDFDTVLKEVEEYGGINPVTMRYYLDTFFNCVRKKMLEDGRFRRVGDYLLLRLNVRGGFDSADEDIETGLQELLVTGQSLDGFRHLEKMADVSNVNARTRGKAESVMSEGGDAGILTFGKNILLKGHDFNWDSTQNVTFNCVNENGEKTTYMYQVGQAYSSAMEHFHENVLEADDTHVLMKWLPTMPRCLIGQRVSVAYIDYGNQRKSDARGSHAYATVVEEKTV